MGILLPVGVPQVLYWSKILNFSISLLFFNYFYIFFYLLSSLMCLYFLFSSFLFLLKISSIFPYSEAPSADPQLISACQLTLLEYVCTGLLMLSTAKVVNSQCKMISDDAYLQGRCVNS